MKPTKMRNSQLYRATHASRSSQMSSPLSNDLQKRYARKSIRVVRGDTVRVVRGEYRGVDGKVAQVRTAASRVTIEGIKKEKTRGDKYDAFIHTSNLVVTDLNTEDRWRAKKLKGEKEAPSEPAAARDGPEDAPAAQDSGHATESARDRTGEEVEGPEPKQTKAEERPRETGE